MTKDHSELTRKIVIGNYTFKLLQEAAHNPFPKSTYKVLGNGYYEIPVSEDVYAFLQQFPDIERAIVSRLKRK